MSETEKAPDTPPRERTLPTEPEQLAAQAAQVAAGQALADHLREAVVHACDVAAFLAAFPPAEKGGAR